MPNYEYLCENCGTLEIEQKISDKTLEECPHCNKKIERQIAKTTFLLKGSGWAKDGYSKKAKNSSNY